MSSDAKREEEKSRDDSTARKVQMEERREETKEEEAIREIDKLDQEIKNAEREKGCGKENLTR